ncbi:integrase [Streptomyces albidoflavus]
MSTVPAVSPAPGSAAAAVAAARAEQVARWTEQYGPETAARLAQAETAADVLGKDLTRDNTVRSYGTAWRVWQRFCRQARLPEREAGRGQLVMYVAWMLDRGRQRPAADGTLGYAPSAARSYLGGTITRLREEHVTVEPLAVREAFKRLGELETSLLAAGERRGRGQAAAADFDGLRALAAAAPDTLAGWRDRALATLAVHIGGRSQDPAGLLECDIVHVPGEGLEVSVRTGKNTAAIRVAKVAYDHEHPDICPVRCYLRYRELLLEEGGPQWSNPFSPAFVGIHPYAGITSTPTPEGRLRPASVAAIVQRAAERAGLTVRWTGHSLRILFASAADDAGVNHVDIADHGGWARGSKSMLGYIKRERTFASSPSTTLTSTNQRKGPRGEDPR